MGKRKGRGGGKSLLSSIEKLVPTVLVAAPGVAELMSGHDGRTKALETVWIYSGYNIVDKNWDAGRLIATYAPPIAAAAAFRIGHKINGLIRRI